MPENAPPIRVPTDMSAVVAIIGVGLIVSISGILYYRRRRARTFGDRPRITLEQIYQQHYLDSGIRMDVVVDLWNDVAKTFGVDPQQLRPDDAFGKELGGGYLITSDDIDALTRIAEMRAKETSLKVDLQTITTLDGYVRTFGHAICRSQ